MSSKLPYVSLGEFPTPVEKLEQLGKDIGINHLFIKRDDLSGKVYGGNKIRKLPRCFHRYFENEVQPLDRNS
ncbi:MAG: pyridoxal-phosphate dependent enzyme [Nitrospira sp.]|nr:pyridoxal-phosphate dependent enzyme [Nitrospira sp.]